MARAIVRNTRIIKLTADIDQGIEVGEIPYRVGLERLRWNGSEIIDLYYLDKFYVDRKTKILYAHPVPNSDLVEMNYNDRKKLIIDNETKKLRIKTKQEVDQPKLDEYKNRRKSEYPDINEQMGAIIKYLKTKNDLPVELNNLIIKIDNIKNKWPKKIS